MELVCPKTKEKLKREGNYLVSGGEQYPIESGVADLRIYRQFSEMKHHRRRQAFGHKAFPNEDFRRRGIAFVGPFPFAIGSYEIELIPQPLSQKLIARLIRKRVSNRSAKIQVNALNKFLEYFQEVENVVNFVDLPYKTGFAQSLSLLLCKKLFWDKIELAGNVLEIGVHNGIASEFVLDASKVTYGVEYVLSSLTNKGHKFKHQNLVCADTFSLPFEDSSANLIVCNQTVPCCYGSTGDLLREISRVLAPGGKFCFTAHGSAWVHLMNDGLAKELRIVDPLIATEFNDIRASYMCHLYTRDEWHRLLNDYDLDVVFEQGYGTTSTSQAIEFFRTFENSGMGLLTSNPQYQNKMNDLFNRIYAYEVSSTKEGIWETNKYLDFGMVAEKQCLKV